MVKLTRKRSSNDSDCALKSVEPTTKKSKRFFFIDNIIAKDEEEEASFGQTTSIKEATMNSFENIVVAPTTEIHPPDPTNKSTRCESNPLKSFGIDMRRQSQQSKTIKRQQRNVPNPGSGTTGKVGSKKNVVEPATAAESLPESSKDPPEHFGFPFGDSLELADLVCELVDETGGWRKFNKARREPQGPISYKTEKISDIMEMIVTTTGRRLFPRIEVKFRKGANTDSIKQEKSEEMFYYLFLDFLPLSEHKFTYSCKHSLWESKEDEGKDDNSKPVRLYLHPECPMTQTQIHSTPFNFEKVKITNKLMDKEVAMEAGRSKNKQSEILQSVKSMQPYYSRVHIFRIPGSKKKRFEEEFVSIVRMNDVTKQEKWLESYKDLCQIGKRYAYKTFDLRETEFMAVTAYQNNGVREFKIIANKYAKGQRNKSGEVEQAINRIDHESGSEHNGSNNATATSPKTSSSPTPSSKSKIALPEIGLMDHPECGQTLETQLHPFYGMMASPFQLTRNLSDLFMMFLQHKRGISAKAAAETAHPVLNNSITSCYSSVQHLRRVSVPEQRMT